MTQLKGAVLAKKLHGGTRVALNFKRPVPVSGAEKASLPGCCVDPVLMPNHAEVGWPEQWCAWYEMEAVLRIGYPGLLISVVQQSMVVHPDLLAFFVDMYIR